MKTRRDATATRKVSKGNNKVSEDSRASKDNRVSKASKDNRVSKVSKDSRVSKVSEANKGSRGNKASKDSKGNRVSKVDQVPDMAVSVALMIDSAVMAPGMIAN
jgi:hypothetical protein